MPVPAGPSRSQRAVGNRMDTVCVHLVGVYVMHLCVCACVFLKVWFLIDCPKLLQCETPQNPDIEAGRRPWSAAGAARAQA